MTKLTLKEAGAKLAAAKNIIIAPHVNPDGDGLGSTLGLYYALRQREHNVRVFVDDDVPAVYHILPGWEKFQKPEKKLNDVDLAVILDAEPERAGRVSQISDAPILNIDHHRSNSGAVDFLYLAPERAATGEIIYELLTLAGIEFNHAMAICLYTAIATDCGFFRYANTTAYTMRAGAHLLEYGVKPNLISEAIEQKPYADVKAMADVINSIELCADGKVAVAQVTKELVAKCSSTEGFVNLLRVIEGVDVAVLLKYKEDKLTRVSMRSKDTNVASVAEALGGGGHVRAAGCSPKLSLGETKEKVLDALRIEMAKK